MGKQFLRTGLAVTALAAATAITWATGTTQAHAEPECTVGSNDFDGNGYADLAIGSPGAGDSKGGVDVILMDDDGTWSLVHVEAPNAQAGDRFGASVAEVAYYEDELDTSTCTQLAVGAPGRDVEGANDAGSVHLFKWIGPENSFEPVKELVQGKDGVPGQAHAGSRFGTSLASSYHEPDIGSIVEPLYIGAPGYIVNGNARAGAVAHIRLTGGSSDPHVGEGTLLTQGSGSIPGTAEVGDAFGQSVAALDNGVLAGSPGENDAAGGIVRWRENDSSQAKFLTQNTSGVPGTSEAGDKFGAAVYAALETRPTGGGYHLLVGAPGEAIGSVKEAGSAIRFTYHGDLEMTKTKGFNQDTSGVAGTAEAGDLFGSSFGSFGPQHLLVGAPGEAIGNVVRAGMVQSLSGNQSWHQDTAGVGGTVGSGDMFGASMGNALVPITGEPDDGWLSLIAIGVPGEDDGTGSTQLGLPGGSGQTRYFKGGQPGDGFGSALGKTN